MVYYHDGTWVWLVSDAHFQDFYPVYRVMLNATIHNNCSDEYTDWIYKNATCGPYMEHLGWSQRPAACAGYYLVNCILDNIPELAKANMASAGVVLGLMPVILTYLSSSTIEVGLLAMRRPFLATLLAVGSPSVNPLRSLDYRNPLEVLAPRILPFQPTGIFQRNPILQTLVQYLLAMIACGNLVFVARDLTRKTIVGNDVNRDYQIIVWACWSFGVHLAGAAAVWLRVEIGEPTHPERIMSIRARLYHLTKPITARIRHFYGITSADDKFAYLQNIIAPCAQLPPTTIRLKRQTWLFTVIAWLVTIATVGHLIYGTLVLSALLFISGGEAVGIVALCMLSVALCRMVLVYELSGMSKTIVVESKEPEAYMLTRRDTDMSLGDNTEARGFSGKAQNVTTSYTGLRID